MEGEGIGRSTIGCTINSPKFLHIIFLKVFAEKEMSFIPTFRQMSNFVKYMVR